MPFAILMLFAANYWMETGKPQACIKVDQALDCNYNPSALPPTVQTCMQVRGELAPSKLTSA